MEQETLFTASKWDILTELQKQAKSPIELARILNTSVANISQQLRLLEMAGLVQSKRISNREKGLPRVLYSLAGNHSYLIATAKEFVDKKFHLLTERNKVVLRIWFLDQPSIHYFLEKAFWSIDDHFANISAVFFDQNQKDLSLVVVTDKASLKSKIKDMKIANPDGLIKHVKFKVLDDKEFKSVAKKELYVLYDPDRIYKTGDET
ncbi:winged helix-turn-helix domain-containing protein [Nanoarchaeota archaeon]